MKRLETQNLIWEHHGVRKTRYKARIQIWLGWSRDPTRDGCIKEFIKRKWNSGLFWAVGAAEKKKPPNCHK